MNNNTTVEIVNVTIAYRAHITYSDGSDSWIGDWPTRRIATQEAAEWVANYGPTLDSYSNCSLCGNDIPQVWYRRCGECEECHEDLVCREVVPEMCEWCKRFEAAIAAEEALA